jgi:hypothetical protein
MTLTVVIKCEVCGDTPVRCFCDAHVPSQGENDPSDPCRLLELMILAGYDNDRPHPHCYQDFSFAKLAELLAAPPPSPPGNVDADKLMAVIDASLARYADIEKYGGLTDLGKHAKSTVWLLKEEMLAALSREEREHG